MPTVRCPGCSRALNLPDFSDAERAVCPLCRREFDLPSRAPPAAAASSSVPPPIIPSLRVHEVDAASAPAASPSESRGLASLSGDDRQAVESAATWLNRAAALGTLHLFCCSCISFQSL